MGGRRRKRYFNKSSDANFAKQNAAMKAKKAKRKAMSRAYKFRDEILQFADYLAAAGIGGSYDDYFKTRHWKKIKKTFCPPGSTCAACNKRPSNERSLNMHHQTYRRLGQELRNDIVLLCEDCHRRLHEYLDAAYPGAPLAFKAEKTSEAFPSLFGKECPQKLSLPGSPRGVKRSRAQRENAAAKITIKARVPVAIEITVTQPETEPQATKKDKKRRRTKTHSGIRHSNIDFSHLNYGYVFRRNDSKQSPARHQPTAIRESLSLGRRERQSQQAEQARSEPAATNSATPDFATA